MLPGSSVIKNPLANEGDIDLIPGSERCPGERNNNLLQYSCLENPMDIRVRCDLVTLQRQQNMKLKKFHYHCNYIKCYISEFRKKKYFIDLIKIIYSDNY